MELRDLLLGLAHRLRRNGPELSLAVDRAGHRPVRPMPRVSFLRAVAARFAAAAVARRQRPLAQVCDVGQFLAQLVSALAQRLVLIRGGHGGLSLLPVLLTDRYPAESPPFSQTSQIRRAPALHDEIVRLRPDWYSDDDESGVIKVVMTGAASDPEDWQRHIGGKARRELLAKRIKDSDDTLRLVIVRDMWLTGFDAPSLHTMYVDKPMRGHGLMQAIARVNRVFRDKPAGLIVDYIGIAQNLKSALGQYSRDDRTHAGIDEAEAVAVLREKYEIVRAMFHGFDFRKGLDGSPRERLATLAGAIEWILDVQQRESAGESTEDGKRHARRRFNDAVLALSKAFALAAASDEARDIRDEVGFFQTVRTALAKSAPGAGKSSAERDLAVQQIVSRAVVSTEIVDILQAAGLETPDISILSDEFLAEVQGMEKKNLALEALRKLINGELRSRSRVNVVQTRDFSRRLEEAIARYHGNAITTAEVLQELIGLARDIRAAHKRGEEEGLSQEEIAFYDALAQNESAVEVMGNDHLRVIAHELLNSLKSNASVDWQHRASARARMRVLVKRILRKHGYPPDLQDAAVQTVLQQAEALSTTWATG